MKALRSFAVRASLPEPLAGLMTVATNLRFAWDARAVELFRWVDPDAWEACGHDPIAQLAQVAPERLAELAADRPFLAFLEGVEEDLRTYLTGERWYQGRRSKGGARTIAYFSPEFGVTEALPVYSGGLGVLSGDHLKAASDLGVPLVGVGLLYRHGYFRQQLSSDGWQQERYPALDPHGMPLTLLSGPDGSALRIEVDLAGARCVAQLWLAQVGRVDLLLLDTDVDDNDQAERSVTDRLYGGDSEHRLRQEVVLGVGGVRALQAAGYDCDVFHSNEGHAGFMGLERIRQLVADHGLDFDEALEAVRAATVFTTHTPVPAGIDVFDAALIERYFESFAKECNVPLERVLELGRVHPPAGDEPATFNMAIMGLRLAGRANGVSRLHGQVARAMFNVLWPEVPADEVPIGAITNGVHTATWLGPEMAEVLDRRLTPGWAEAGGARWERIADVPDAELWRARERARERLVYFVRARLARQLRAKGVTEAELAWVDDVFDPGILTIGFARRFALYKRGNLVLSDPERLKALLLSSDRPVQFVFAGKAHPLDDGGKEVIRSLVHFASDPEVRARFAFIEDHDMEVARHLTQCCDVWLNNPRRPLEACGTSGMKAALNGVLNCSTLDGWWDECFDGRNGWAIGMRETYDDPALQDRVEASALYDLLEREIVPRFYDRSEGPLPRRWIERIKASIASLGPQVTADRMVRDYVEHLYEPAARSGRRMAEASFARARALAAWKAKVRAAWPGVAVIDVQGDARPAELREERTVRATVRIGDLSTDDVAVQLAHGRVGANDELIEPEIVEMRALECVDGTCTYEGCFVASAAGLYGFAVRVVPRHEDLINPMDLGLVAWA